jgi:hypothetical protein
MNKNIISSLLVALGLISFLMAAVYNGYLAWFHPERFKSRALNTIRDWWPFAKFFRSYYSSSEFVWGARAMTVTVILIYLFFAVLTILGYIGLIP